MIRRLHIVVVLAGFSLCTLLGIAWGAALVAFPATSSWSLSNASELSTVAGGIKLNDASDNFNDGVRGWQWTETNNGGTIGEAGGVLTITPNTSSGDLNWASAAGSVAGDFDIQVDWNVAWTGLSAGKEPAFRLIVVIDGSNYALINEQGSGVGAGLIFRAVSNVSGSPVTNDAATTATSGKFRLMRVGTVVYAMYETTGGWVVLQTRTGFSTSAGYIRLEAYGATTAYPSVSFDNFVVNGGKWYPADGPTATSPWASVSFTGLDVNTPIHLIENGLGGTGSVKYEYALNNGSLSNTWVTQTTLQALLANSTITNFTNSIRLQAQFNSDGTQAVEFIPVWINTNGVSNATGTTGQTSLLGGGLE